VHYYISDALRFFLCIGCVNSRTHSMKPSTTGLTVRFFSVNIANCHGRTDNSTGNIFIGAATGHSLGLPKRRAHPHYPPEGRALQT
jgi:hypothetical protein